MTTTTKPKETTTTPKVTTTTPKETTTTRNVMVKLEPKIYNFMIFFNSLIFLIAMLGIIYYLFFNDYSLSLFQISVVAVILIYFYLYFRFSINKTFQSKYNLKLKNFCTKHNLTHTECNNI